MNRRVYLDHNASTPVHPEVLQAMLPYFSERYGNPSSVHGFGRESREGIDAAREQIAAFLKVSKDEIVFTSGGTESDNLGIKGVAAARRAGHIITSQIEHHAVLRTVQTLEREGFTATYLPVDGDGMVSPDDVRAALRPDTIVVSLMGANSEVGTLQPIREIGRITREVGVPLHVDGVQTFGKVPIDVEASGIDLLSFSGHKIYGPKGVAGLYIRKGTKMASIQHGGEHERRRRAGTENVAGIGGLGMHVRQCRAVVRAGGHGHPARLGHGLGALLAGPRHLRRGHRVRDRVDRATRGQAANPVARRGRPPLGVSRALRSGPRSFERRLRRRNPMLGKARRGPSRPPSID